MEETSSNTLRPPARNQSPSNPSSRAPSQSSQLRAPQMQSQRAAPEMQNGSERKSARPMPKASGIESQKSFRDQKKEEWEEINDDVYNMFFLSSVGGQAFWYGIYVFILKLTLYSFLAWDAIVLEKPKDVEKKVVVTQFVMLPVSVAMQDDLIATYFLIANLKYSPLIKLKNPHASKWKFHVANICRGIDGMCSLLVNFIILMKATEVLSLFLNFAALQFLQTLDNIALSLCKDGYLSEKLEMSANRVLSTKLPNKNNEFLRSMDSILFLSTFCGLLVAWAVMSFA